MKNVFTALRSALMLTCLSSPAQAVRYDTLGAHVEIVEGTYSPGSILFVTDKSAGACQAGTVMTFTPQGSNDTQKAASASAVMASLLSAKFTGTTITFGGDDATCQAGYVQNR